MPGLDGLRALAVVAVLLYHAELPSIPGGFLGVEVFFVISGYLVTALLLAEWRATGRVAVGRFWLRRARRLLPALFVLLVITLTIALVWLPDEAAGLRGDGLAALGYVTNWYLISDQRSYFELVGRPSLLRHLWSLAIEEQFYFLWPILLAGALRRWRPRALLAAVVAGALVSALLMALLFVPDADPSRLYYGTDTRAAALLAGAALAFVWSPGRAAGGRLLAFLLDACGLAALLALGWCAVAIDEFQPLLYTGGFALVSLLSVVLIAAMAQRGWLGQVLGCPPLRYIGLRSYSLYLWHWPVFMLSRPQLDLPLEGMPLLALRLGVSLLLAELCYRLVERPVRAGALGRGWREWRMAIGERQRTLDLRWSMALGGAGTWLVLLILGLSLAQRPTPPPELADDASSAQLIPATALLANRQPSATPVPTRQPTLTAEPSASPLLAPTQPTAEATAEPTLVPPTAEPTPAPPTAEPTPAPQQALHITAIGDSVMLGAADELRASIEHLHLDAKVGRQVGAAIALLRARRDAGQLGDVVVVHVGNNSPLSPKRFAELMDVLGDVRRVVVINLKVPRRWEQPNNAVLAEQVALYPNAVLLDWHGASMKHPDLFWRDGMHLRPSGARLYAELIARSVSQS